MIRVTLDKASVVSRGQPKRALLSVCAIAAIVMAGPLRAVAEKPADPGEKSEKSEKKEKRKKGKKQARPNKGKETPPPAEAEESPPLPSDVGAQENPRAPVTAFEEFEKPKVVAQAKAPAAPVAYPIERALRPITLPRRMTEATIDAPSTFNPYVLSGLLGARHGVTRQIQAGLRYGTGTLRDGDYFAGKAFSVDGEYQVFPWLAGQVSLPILVDPFAMGVTLGAPMKFTFLDRLRFDIFRDFIAFKVSRFAPSVADAAFNDAQVQLDETNTALDDGEINLNAGATWQLRPDLAIEGRYGLKARDFEFRSDSPTLLDVGLIYSSTNKIDIGGRLGFADLNDADTTFGVWLLA